MSQAPSPDHLSAELRAQFNAAKVDPAAFAKEQEALGRVWNFLGFAHQIPRKNDWFTAMLGGRNIFVQRFEQGIAAFENRCAHRNYPLRVGEKGNGPVLCGFHHWRYNHEGVALGIPHCPGMFGKTPREMDARLPAVEVAQVGGFLFGRFTPPEGGPDIQTWLGPAYAVLTHISGWLSRPAGGLDCAVASHWRPVMEISLDDYHLVAVHPTTFGKGGYIPADGVHYERFGAHSAFFRNGDASSLLNMVAECEAGTFLPQRYRIIQLFPKLIISFAHALNYLGEGYWYMIVQDIVPEAHNKTRTRMRFFRIPHVPGASALRRALRWLAWISVDRIFRFFARRVHLEDNAACAELQSVARHDDAPPRLALHEQRIGWFEMSLAQLLSSTPQKR